MTGDHWKLSGLGLSVGNHWQSLDENYYFSWLFLKSRHIKKQSYLSWPHYGESSKKTSSVYRKVNFVHPLFPSVFVLFLLSSLWLKYDALDPNCAKREFKYASSPGGNRPRAVFSIRLTITKWIFDLDRYIHFLSPATPWRTKQFSCYPWTATGTLNSTPQAQSEQNALQET